MNVNDKSKKLKILHLSESDLLGGAAIASFRIHKMFLNHSCNSKMVVEKKKSLSNEVLVIKRAGKLKLFLLKFLSFILYVISGSVASFIMRTPKDYFLIKKEKYDVIFIHWTGRLLPDLKLLSLCTDKIFFVFHDCLGVSGFLHYPIILKDRKHFCKNVISKFLSKKIHDLLLSKKIFEYKKNKVRFIFPSKWLYEYACQQSNYFSNDSLSSVIHYPATFEYKKYQRLDVKSIYNSGRSICFGAVAASTDERKGFNFFIKGLRKSYNENKGKISEIIVFGLNTTSPDLNVLKNLPIKISCYNQIDNEEVLRIFSQSHIVVLPSLQDNLPNACIESLTVGTPVVSFNIGGFKDMIEHKINGYLSDPYDENDLASGISYLLNLSKEDYLKMRKSCIKLSKEKFSEQKIFNAYSNAIYSK